MSTQSASRKRAQKHTNAKAWKVDLKHHKDVKTKQTQSLVVTNCCEKCTSVINWKIQYGKYKPLTQPGKCIRCHEKKVRFAYHTVCTSCVQKHRVCAKCNAKDAEVVNEPRPTPTEEARLSAELQKELKALPERKRRTFLRYLQKQEEGVTGVVRKSKNIEEFDEDDDNSEGDDEPEGKVGNAVELNNVRKEALGKLKELGQKYGRRDADFDDFDLDDLEDLDLSEEDDE